MNEYRIRIIVYMSLFIALEVVLTRFLSIQTPIVRIGFTFLPIAISAMTLGPVLGGTAAAIADIIGMMLFPSGGAYFPGFTVTAFLTGVVYGLFLYKKHVTLFRIGLSVIVVTIFITLCLDTLWLWMITGQAILAILPARIVKCIVTAPIQVFMIHVMWRHVIAHLDVHTARA